MYACRSMDNGGKHADKLVNVGRQTDKCVNRDRHAADKLVNGGRQADKCVNGDRYADLVNRARHEGRQ